LIELRDIVFKIMEEEPWFELKEEISADVAEALRRNLNVMGLTTEMIERALYLEWNVSSSSNAIVTTTDTRFKGSGIFFIIQKYVRGYNLYGREERQTIQNEF